MKKIIVSLLLVAIAIKGSAQTTSWSVDKAHAKIGFSITHFGISEIEGRFTKFDGTVMADKPDFSDAKIQFSIDVTSIDTEQSQRDTHLKSADFFDAGKYPSIMFKSKSLKLVSKNKYALTGDLTMHGVTKEVNLDLLYKGTIVDPDKKTRAGFKISGVIDRTLFGLAWNGQLASGDLAIGNDVTLGASIELVK